MKKSIVELLNLDKPICFIDLESTGTDVANDKIVEISVLKEDLNGDIEIKTRRFNPGIPIPAEATETHGISDDDVKDEPAFCMFAKGLYSFIKDCHLAGFNSNSFDFPLLSNEFARCGIEMEYEGICFVDGGNIYKKLAPRKLANAYELFCGEVLENAHSAEADIKATYEVVLAQISNFEEVPKDIKALAIYSNYDKPVVDLAGKFTLNEEKHIIYAFGKNKGKRITEDLRYLSWMFSDKAEFIPDTKQWAKKLYDKYSTNQQNLFAE